MCVLFTWNPLHSPFGQQNLHRTYMEVGGYEFVDEVGMVSGCGVYMWVDDLNIDGRGGRYKLKVSGLLSY